LIAEALKGKTILVTGSTGFLGKSIVEKCLRSIPKVGRLNLAIRSSARRSASERLEKEVLSSPAFKRLKEELGEDAFARLVAEKIGVVEIDLGRDGLGLNDSGREQLRASDIVIHSAAAVEFDNPADLSAQTNLLGAARMVDRALHLRSVAERDLDARGPCSRISRIERRIAVTLDHVHDPLDGRIAKIYPKVKAQGHAEQVLAAL